MVGAEHSYILSLVMVLLLLQEAIQKAATAVCSKIPAVENVCQKIITGILNGIAQFILNGYPYSDICVTLRMCKS